MSPRSAEEAASEAGAAQVPRFYAGRSVLVTGGTGFMGKVLLQRLLATCPDVGPLFLLMRPKHDVSPDKRLAQLKQSQVFASLRATSPRQLDKLRAIEGDTALPALGLSPDALHQLQHVSVVFNSAATLKFEEPLERAVEQNVRSVIRLLDLCDQLPNLEVVVHVSTAYSNTEHAEVAERVYPPPAPLDQLLALADALPTDFLKELTPRLLGKKPNTYTFTKAMAESVIQQRTGRRYPISIFRPSIVVSAVREPCPGWIENLNGPSGVVCGVGSGVLHVMNSRTAALADLLPVDIAIDTLIAAAWETALDNNVDEVKVYNCTSGENPITWGEFERHVLRAVRDHPFRTTLWYPFGFCVQNYYTYKVFEWLLHTLPLRVADFVVKQCGIKMKVSLARSSERLRAMVSVLRFFATNEWRFLNDNVVRLRRRLAPADAALYNLDPRSFTWKDHCDDFVKGTRKYLLREKEQDSFKARRRLMMLYVVHQAVVCAGCAAALRAAGPPALRLLRRALSRVSRALAAHT